MKKILVFLFFCFNLFSQESIEVLLENMQKAQEKIDTLEANFYQKKTSKLFTSPQEQKGVIYFKKPDFIRWEYTQPESYITFISKDTFQIYYPSLKKVKKGKIVRLRGRIFSLLFAQEPLQKLKNYFTIELRKKEMEDVLVLTPQVFKLKKYWKEWKLVIDKSKFLPVSIEVLEKDGDLTHIEFKNLKINVQMDEKIFEFIKPPDVIEESYTKSGD